MRFNLIILSILLISGCSNDRLKNSETKNPIIESTIAVNDKPINLNRKFDNNDSIELLGYLDLRKLRNEIFARKGLIFKSNDLNNYFKKFDWYEPKFRNPETVLKLLNKIEKFNIDFVRQIEKQKGFAQTEHYILENYKDNDMEYIHCGDTIKKNSYKSFLINNDTIRFHIYKEMERCGSKHPVELTMVSFKIELIPLDFEYNYLKKTITGSSLNIGEIEIFFDNNFIFKITRTGCCGEEPTYQYYRLTDSKAEKLNENEIKSYTQHAV